MAPVRDIANRFDLLRLAAALAVFVAHGDFLYRLHLPVPFPGHSLGSLAVYVFFFVSGYLVCQSWAREPVWRSFWIKRLTRIFPGLAVAVAFSVVVVGWVTTTLSSAQYWGASATWLALLNNALGLATLQTLPGVFESNPFARTVNGSLWTIRYELAMYSMLAVLAWSFRGRRWVYPLAAGALAATWLLARAGGWDARLEAAGDRGWTDVFRWRDFCGFGVPFFLGSTFAAYGLRFRPWMVGIAMAAAGVALWAGSEVARQAAVWLLIAFGALAVAFGGQPAGVANPSTTRTDISYGVYIYAFPIQQAMTQWCLALGWPLVVCMALALTLVLPLAWLSWYWIEHPCLRFAQRMIRKA